MNEIIEDLPKTFQTPTMAPFCKDEEKYKVVENLLLQVNEIKSKKIKIDNQIVDRIFKFASIKHILNNYKNDQQKILELLGEFSRDLKNHELELRIEELESKFSEDLSESTFNEIRELKEKKKLQNIN